MSDTRNPYVMLGIPFGSPRDVATRAFARKARGRRHDRASTKSGVTDLTQLTWALNQVEENIRDPRTALHLYRVPADPAALEPQASGILRPGPEPMPRVSPSSEAAWGRLLDAARGEALRMLHHQIAESASLPER